MSKDDPRVERVKAIDHCSYYVGQGAGEGHKSPRHRHHKLQSISNLYSVDLVIFANSDFSRFGILGLFVKPRIRELSTSIMEALLK